MELGAVSAASAAPARQRPDDLAAISGLVVLLALAAAAFGQGAYFGAVRLLVVILLAVAVLLALVASRPRIDDLSGGFAVAGVLLAGWALVRGWAAGPSASEVDWVLFGAGTVAVVLITRRLNTSSRAMLFGGLVAVGVAIALAGWLGVALHLPPWGVRSQGLWRAASPLTYTNATAALLVPLVLATLARLAAAPRSHPFGLAATCLLVTIVLSLSRAGIAALGTGLLVLCWLLGPWRVLRAAAVPAAGACVALLGIIPSLRAGGPAQPGFAAVTMAAGLGLVIAAQQRAGWKLAVPVAGAALAGGLALVFLVPQIHHIALRFVHARLTLASPARSGETAAALRLIGAHLLAGAGPGHAILRWTSAGGAVNVDQYVHDEYLQVLTDLGIVGGLLTAFLLVAAGRLLWRARVRAGSPGRALWAAAVAAAAAFLLHSGFDFIWQLPAIPLTTAAIVGLTIGQPARQHESPPSMNEHREPTGIAVPQE